MISTRDRADREHAAEQQRLETLFDLADAQRDEDRRAYCVVGRHDVQPSSVRISPRGNNVCRTCAQTPAGQKELTPFDPCA